MSNLTKKTQSSMEYLIIIGVGLFILAAALSYAFYYSTSYNGQQYSQQLGLAVQAISGAVNSLTSQGLGSTQHFTFTSPGLSLASDFCSGYISLSYTNQVASGVLSLPTFGELPVNGGTYSGYVKLINKSGQVAADIRMNLPVSYINSSYLITPSSVFYNISFYSITNQLVGDVNFTIMILTPEHSLIAEQNVSAVSGEYSGSVPISTYDPNALILVYSPSQGIIYPSCFSPSTSLLLPSGIVSYTPVTITNHQSSATPAPFQQMVTVDSANYAYVEASNLQNVEFFYSNGTVIPSWLESGNIASFTDSLLNVSSVQNFPTNYFTVGLWLYSYGNTVSNPGGTCDHDPLIKGQSEAASNRFGIAGGCNTNTITAEINNGNTLYYPINTNQWYFVVETYNGSALKLYVDGTVVEQNNSVGAFVTNSYPLYLGGDGAGGRYFNGSMADVSVYDTALSASKISTLYGEGMGASPVSGAGLAEWLPLNGTTKDYSGNGNNGVSDGITPVTYNAVASSSTNTTYWLKLPSILAFSSITVYMGFALTSTNFFNTVNDGEAPQLSSTYGQYDDGVNIFSFYENFAGASLPSGWQELSSTVDTYSVDNGITFTNAGRQDDVSVGTTSAVATPGVLEMDITSGSDARPLLELSTTDTQVGGGPTIMYGDGYGMAYGMYSGDMQFEIQTTTYSNIPNVKKAYNSPLIVGAGWPATGTQLLETYQPGYINLQTVLESNTANTIASSLFIVLGQGGAGSTSDTGGFTASWVRVRAFPPNGVMPSVSIGAQQPSVTVFVNGVKNGNNGISFGTETNITATSSPFLHLGLEINSSTVVPIGSGKFTYANNLNPGLYNITVVSNNSFVKNVTYWEAVASLPANVEDFIPLTITNGYTQSTPSPFQQRISIDSLSLAKYENDSLSNIEFFTPSGKLIQSWLEGGNVPYFDGANSQMNLPENIPVAPNAQFSVSIWFKTTSDGGVLWNGNNLPGNSPTGYSNIIYVTTSGDLAGGDWVGSEPFYTNINVANGKWHNVVITQTGSEQILYLDGTEIASQSGAPQSLSPYYWTVGYGYGGWPGMGSSPFYFNGYISNLQFYGQILSPTQVANLFDEGTSGSPLNSSDLIAWWLLSGNGNEANGNNNIAASNVAFNGVSSISTNTTYWLKINSSLSSSAPYIAFLGFTAPSIDVFNTVNTGEAPQLSPTYGQYDDGANVFNYYQRWGGLSSLPSGWVEFGADYSLTYGATYLTITTTDTGSTYGGVYTTTQVPSIPSIYEFYGNIYTSTSNSGYYNIVGILDTSTPSSSPYSNSAYVIQVGSRSDFSIVGDNNGYYYDTGYADQNITQIYGLAIPTSTSAQFFYSYNPTPVTTGMTSETTNSFAFTGSGGSPLYIYWYRVRAYPPNGVMPYVSMSYLNGRVS